ncbi:MAG: D-alanine--D-alanine ligase [Labilithrix sp.]|nr:D-alanine--D-alanine ligase [Labilithrix sp.]MCW5816922.1 D-alanine--D-alanine ligase [Labilithrix sp.]
MTGKGRRLAIAVVQGGPTSEAEVSRASAASVAKALAAAGHRPVRLELNGHLAESLRTGGFELVFPVAHGAVGEDGSLQGLLEVLELPYVGSDVLASALAMNKRVAKVLFADAGLPIAKGLAAKRGARSAAAEAERAIAELGSKVVVKPCSNGSAIGVARFDAGGAAQEIAAAIDAAWAVDETALVEALATGREVTCGVLDLHHAEAQALPPTEIRAPNDAFYTYQARYAPGRSEHLCPAPLGDALVARVRELAVMAHRALGCRDLSRVDFVVGEQPTLLEVNTMPGFTDTSLYPEAAGVAGIPMPELCDRLATAAFERGPTRRNAPLPLPR